MAKSKFKRRKIFLDLVPPLSKEERTELKASIATEGCREQVVLMQGDVIVDGDHRDQICGELGIETPFRIKTFLDDNAAIAWALRNQIGRRNLSPKFLKLTIGRLYNLTKSDGHGAQRSGYQADTQNGHGAQRSGYQADTQKNDRVRDEIAGEFKVSSATVSRAGKRAKAYDRLVGSAQKIAEKLSDAQVIALAAKPKKKQQAIARSIRVGQNTAAELLPTKPKKPPKVVDEFKTGFDLYGKLVRWVDDMGGKKGKGLEYRATLAAVKAVHDAIDAWKKAQ